MLQRHLVGSLRKSLVTVIVLLATVYLLFSVKEKSYVQQAAQIDVENDYSEDYNPPQHQPTLFASDQPSCAHLPSASEVLVVMKTGATEAHQKLPMHFNTTFRCIPHWVIYSDLSETIAGYAVHDVLDDIPSWILAENPDEFNLYFALRQARDEGVELPVPEGEGEDNEAWILDKWKFLSMIRKAYAVKPDAKWFFFMEADTFILWSNLLRYVSFLDPDVPEYRGGAAWIDDIIFAHGGSGILLSHAAVQIAVEALKGNESNYLGPLGECCGDLVVSKFLQGNGVEFTSAYPLIQGEHPATLDYTEEKWCRPVISYHHVNQDTLLEMWNFEQQWQDRNPLVTESEEKRRPISKPILHKDIFDTFLAPLITNPSGIHEWDNLSKDRILRGQGDEEFLGPESEEKIKDLAPDLVKNWRLAHTSMAACERACLAKGECMQFAYRGSECRLGFAIRLGEEAVGDEEGLQSRWIIERVVDARSEAASQCAEKSEEEMFFTENY